MRTSVQWTLSLQHHPSNRRLIPTEGQRLIFSSTSFMDSLRETIIISGLKTWRTPATWMPRCKLLLQSIRSTIVCKWYNSVRRRDTSARSLWSAVFAVDRIGQTRAITHLFDIFRCFNDVLQNLVSPERVKDKKYGEATKISVCHWFSFEFYGITVESLSQGLF